ncbi:hypothetical protein AAFN88_20260 [Pelagibius sp. CAU 1746]|uniref:hypothetical protein n=1 Tax=Pelagibius sp. CAU 1746 TaxID=3140370 RepID=UPI00325C0CE8
MRLLRSVLLSLVLGAGATGAGAEPMTLDVVLTTTDDISLNFQNDTRHFLTLLLREGTAEGNGVFEGATVAEYGMHDVTGGVGGEASGYIVATTTGGDIAYFRWLLRAFFVEGTEGKSRLVNSGLWELAGGTGQFAAARGTGALTIGFPSKTERRYLLTGDISPSLEPR